MSVSESIDQGAPETGASQASEDSFQFPEESPRLLLLHNLATLADRAQPGLRNPACPSLSHFLLSGVCFFSLLFEEGGIRLNSLHKVGVALGRLLFRFFIAKTKTVRLTT